MNRQDRLRALCGIWIISVGITLFLLVQNVAGWHGIAVIGVLTSAAVTASRILLAPPHVTSLQTPTLPLQNESWTVREREILSLIARGYTNEAIADELVIALSTVKTHINNIYRKLGVSNRAQAVRSALELNLT